MSNLASFLEKGLSLANTVLEQQQQQQQQQRTQRQSSYSEETHQVKHTSSSSSSSSSLEALDKLFASAEQHMNGEDDKQILSHLKQQVSQLFQQSIGSGKSYTTTTTTSSSSKYNNNNADSDEEEEEGYAERAEHAHLNQLAQDYNTYDKGDDDSDSDKDDDNNNGDNDNQVTSRGINRNKNHQLGNDGFYTVNTVKKQRHHANHYRKQISCNEFRPDYLSNVSNSIYCMPMFFPSEDSYNTFHSALSSAQEKLHIAIFSLTDNATANVIIDAKERGVDVRIIADNDQLEAKGGDVLRLHRDYGIPLKTDNSEQFMHNKFAIIDEKIVITGSFNWSIGARFKNRENIVITNIPEVVSAYDKEFKKLWSVIEQE